MDQMSFFNIPAFPASYDDVDSLYREYIYEGETDEDAFTWSEIKDGRSYFMYGKKVIEFYPDSGKGARLRVFPLEPGAGARVLRSGLAHTDLMPVLDELKQMKRTIFRSTVTEVFGCCNDFVKCSDQKQCIHPEDRFYNGCMYRTNLEAGRIFYGKNRNV
jgi:hypothetical protein